MSSLGVARQCGGGERSYGPIVASVIAVNPLQGETVPSPVVTVQRE